MDKTRRAPDGAQHWDERSLSYGKELNDTYADEFIQKMGLTKKSFILDMGCGTGMLAIPLAKRGHGVIAADFSEGMLDRLREDARAVGVKILEARIDDKTGKLDLPRKTDYGLVLQKTASLQNVGKRSSWEDYCRNGRWQEGFIIPLKLSWSDDWFSLGIDDNMVDVALASRSLITHDLADSLDKLSRVARHHVYVTADLGVSPRVNPVVAQAMGISLDKHNDAVFVFGIAHELGFEPEVSYIHSPRIREYQSRDEAYHALLKTLDYADTSKQIDEASAKQRLRDWLLVHLIPRNKEGTWQLDKPQIIPWAFIHWKTW